jgi:hypothetical protein
MIGKLLSAAAFDGCDPVRVVAKFDFMATAGVFLSRNEER